MSTTLEQGLIILVFTSIIVLVVLTVFAVKVLINFNKLTKNLDETTVMLNEELKPTIKELNEVLVNVNKIADKADMQFNSAKQLISKILGVSGLLFNGVKSFSGSFFKGFTTAMSMFTKK